MQVCPALRLLPQAMRFAARRISASLSADRYDEPGNREVMIASAEVEFEGYCKWTRVQEIIEFARKTGAKKIGIANCIGLIREARSFA